MNVHQPIETEQKTSWKSKIEAMEVNSELAVAFRSAPTARHAIWTIQNTSNKKYLTHKDGPAVIVKRVA